MQDKYKETHYSEVWQLTLLPVDSCRGKRFRLTLRLKDRPGHARQMQ